MQQITSQSDVEIKKVLTKIYNEFQKHKTIKKSKLLESLPAYLNKPGTTKAIQIEKWKKDVTEEQFIKLLKTQTEGAEYHSFEYFILKYNLKTDDNDMIIFTDEFPFDRSIKKEALFIWGILNALKNHQHFGEFYDYLLTNLQISYESYFIDKNNRMRYDMGFPNLNIVIEIDENHTSAVARNDYIKTITAEMNGTSVCRLNFQKIFVNKYGTSRGNIKNGENANKEMFNSKAYTKFLNDLYYKLGGAMMKDQLAFRELCVMHLYKISVQKQIDEINSSLQENIAQQDKIKKTLNSSKVTKKIINQSKYDIISDLVENNKIALNKYMTISDFIKNDDTFVELFKIKDMCVKSKDPFGKIIQFERVAKVVKAYDEDKEEMLIDFLYKSGILTKLYDLQKDIHISWKDLSRVIIDYSEVNDSLKMALILYYTELEESYEKILHQMDSHTKTITATMEKYITCIKNETQKIKKSYKDEIYLIKKKMDDLNTRYKKLVNDHDNLNFKYKSVNLAYNRVLNGEWSHTRSASNIEFNIENGMPEEYITSNRYIEMYGNNTNGNNTNVDIRVDTRRAIMEIDVQELSPVSNSDYDSDLDKFDNDFDNIQNDNRNKQMVEIDEFDISDNDSDDDSCNDSNNEL